MSARLLLPVLPEIVLALGAMALLMVGAYRERSVQLVNGCAFALLALAGLRDLGRREILVFAPLVFLTILFGIYPKPVLDMSAASVAQLLENYQAAVSPKKSAMEASRPPITVAK